MDGRAASVGQQYGVAFSDVYLFDPSDCSFERVEVRQQRSSVSVPLTGSQTRGDEPPPRYGHSMCLHNDHCIVFGGRSTPLEAADSVDTYSDVHLLRLSDMR